MSRKISVELENLHSQTLAMGGHVEQQIGRALSALTEGDSQLGLEVAHDDYKINHMEARIDEACGRMLATQITAASDRRLILAIIKTITDLERIGDEAEKIGFLASRLAGMDRPPDNYEELKHLGRQVHAMVHKALDAFARLNANASLKVVKQDQLVDQEYQVISRQSIAFMMENPHSIRRVLDAIWIARALERIGDHAKNIGEYVIYIVTGKDVRHTEYTDMKAQLRKGH